jgi:hypothetical protein
MARERGVLICIDTDAHSTRMLNNLQLGILTARRAGASRRMLSTRRIRRTCWRGSIARIASLAHRLHSLMGRATVLALECTIQWKACETAVDASWFVHASRG